MAYPTPLDGLARNPATPAPILIRLLDTDAAYTICLRRHLPSELVEAMVSHPQARIRLFLAQHPHVPEAQRARLIRDPDPRVRACLAAGDTDAGRHPLTLPPEAYEVLVTDEDEDVRLALTGAFRLPDHLWPVLLDDPSPRVRLFAQLRLAPRDPDLAATLLDDPAVSGWHRGNLLSQAKLPRDRFASLAADPSAEVRAAIAANRLLPHDLVTALGRDPEPSVRLAASMHPCLSEQERAEIDYTVGPRDRVQTPPCWSSQSDDLDLMRQAATSAHLGLRRAAARSRHLPQDLVAFLAADEDFIVRLLLAESHPNAPAELLLSTTIESEYITKYDQVDHPNFPRIGLAARVASASDPHTRLLAVLDPTAPAALIEALSREFPRSHASADPRLSLERILALLADPSTAPIATQNPALPVAKMQEIIDAAI